MNREINEHIKDRIRKTGQMVIKQVWRIGRKKIGKNIREWTWLFDILVWMILDYRKKYRDGRKIRGVEKKYLI